MRKDELLDLVDKEDKVIGTVWKSEAHKDRSKIHREIAVVLFNTLGETLIQQRNLKKDIKPGEWKVTAAGHVGLGEDPKVAAKRELFEEMRIRNDVTFHSKIFQERKGNGSEESRYIYVYYGVVEGRINFTIDKSEVNDAKWIRPEDLVNFAKENSWDLNSLSHKLIFEIQVNRFKN